MATVPASYLEYRPRIILQNGRLKMLNAMCLIEQGIVAEIDTFCMNSYHKI